MFRILSIDGGGIRGLIPALILAEIERRTGKQSAELFDLIGGTSTGGILALTLAKGYPAAHVVNLYEKEGSTIFARPLWRRITSIHGLVEEKFPASGIEQVLEQYFGDARLKDARTEVLITSYELERRIPFFFKSRNAHTRSDYDFLMKDIARATSAAPTYFEPLRLPDASGADYYALIDGGVFANNPAMCCLVEARCTHPDAGDFFVVSMGTGSQTTRIPYENAKRWGMAGWAKPILDIVFDGVSSAVDYQIRQLLPGRYHRFQPSLEPGKDAMDDASPEILRSLRVVADLQIRQRDADLDAVCEALLQPRKILPVLA